jgi:hypothetical protein
MVLQSGDVTPYCILLVRTLDFTICKSFHLSLYRPVQGGKRVPPDELRNHRESHHFLGPCCLCPLLSPRDSVGFVEAAIYMPVFGRYGGEIIAACAKDRCGYLGQPRLNESKKITLTAKLVPLERAYPKHGVHVKEYPLRGMLAKSAYAQQPRNTHHKTRP